MPKNAALFLAIYYSFNITKRYCNFEYHHFCIRHIQIALRFELNDLMERQFVLESVLGDFPQRLSADVQCDAPRHYYADRNQQDKRCEFY